MRNKDVLARWLWNEYQEGLLAGRMPDAVFYFSLYQEVQTNNEEAVYGLRYR